MHRLGSTGWWALALVVAAAAGARCWYVAACADYGHARPPLEVQGKSPPSFEGRVDEMSRLRKQSAELQDLAHNIQVHGWFGCRAWLSEREEETAHVAPGYPWIMALAARWDMPADAVLRWAQVVLGVLTAACYFFFARRVFSHDGVALVAGLLCALHPFWIINVAELNDGTLATFLFAASLTLGCRADRVGGPFVSLLFGLSLAGLAMTRAAFLPFACVAMLWFLLRCRTSPAGWFGALLAFLGFANGLAPWAVRTWLAFETPVPIADSAMLHFYMGNNPRATGGTLDETSLRASLASERLQELLSEPNQARRYAFLGKDAAAEVLRDPGAALGRRLNAGLLFLVGEEWWKTGVLALQAADNPERGNAPEWVSYAGETALRGSLLFLAIAGLIGWRACYAWRAELRLATLALVFVPMPYVLTHAGPLSGPRLPLDGVLLCLAALALTSFWVNRARSETAF
ncbi:MAG: glycosyltransferase family 39 protein [Gemmataceae bacterium]|nr:glycosyltransferase family 39 protein [Gemmataceae bacterium]MCI0743011.1 glycosyltransferase family 39 protein [Gemmataceae bacterium]